MTTDKNNELNIEGCFRLFPSFERSRRKIIHNLLWLILSHLIWFIKKSSLDFGHIQFSSRFKFFLLLTHFNEARISFFNPSSPPSLFIVSDLSFHHHHHYHHYILSNLINNLNNVLQVVKSDLISFGQLHLYHAFNSDQS